MHKLYRMSFLALGLITTINIQAASTELPEPLRFQRALFSKDTAALEALVKDGVPRGLLLNERTVLMTAVITGSVSKVELLLNKGAYASASVNGDTALKLATRLGHKDIMELLRAAEAEEAAKAAEKAGAGLGTDHGPTPIADSGIAVGGAGAV